MYQPHLHRFLDLEEALFRDRMVEEDGKMDLGDVAILVTVDEVREGDHTMTAGWAGEFLQGSGEEVKHHRTEMEALAGVAVEVEEEIEKVGIGMTAVGDEDGGSRV